MLTERRCEPGAPTIDGLCERHSEHYWCPWCEGFYGVPHVDEFGSGGCHSQPVTHSREDPNQCACRFCRILRDHGWDAATAFRDTQIARARNGHLPQPPDRVGPIRFLRVGVEFADTAWERLVGLLQDVGTAEAIGVANRIDAQLQAARTADATDPPSVERRRRWRRR